MAYQPSIGRIADRGQHFRPVDAVAAALDHLRHDVIGLLRQLDAGLQHAAVIERIRVQRLDLRQHGRVVGRFRVQPVTAEDLDALLLRLRLERVRQPDAVGAAVVQNVDRSSLAARRR